MYRPFTEVFNRRADFRVSYRIYSQEEGGSYTLPVQGIRWNFKYENTDHVKGNIFIILPEFEDTEGNIITETDLPVPENGTARMWILNEDYLIYHKGKIKVGTVGYFMEGARKVGKCEVIELLSLKD